MSNTIFSAKDCLDCIVAAGPGGIAPDAIEKQFAGTSRSTINRRLSELVSEGNIRSTGAGRAVRYVSTAPFTIAEISNYLSQSWQTRPVATFKESMLDAAPLIDLDKARRLESLIGLAGPLDRKFLANFLIDFSWGSSVLEGSTYSAMDTEALVLYGQKNPDKPIEDALLVVNHKQAIEYLWAHRELDVPNICAMQSMLTDQHGLPEAEASDHFLPTAQRGIPREYEDVTLAQSAYLPPYRPGTGYVRGALDKIVETAKGLSPVESAFYLMTRIPYLQAFANGNKRTARLAANLPLLANNLLPISFVDFDRVAYIRGMAAFYELNTCLAIEKTFIEGYVRSIIRGSNVPPSMRVAGLDIEGAAANLTNYVYTGAFPKDAIAAAFVGAAPPPAARRKPR